MNLAVVIPTIYDKNQAYLAKNIKSFVKAYNNFDSKDKLKITFFIYFNQCKTNLINELVLEKELNKKFFKKNKNLLIKVFITELNQGFTGAVNNILDVISKDGFSGFLIINDDACVEKNFFNFLKITNNKVITFLIKHQNKIESYGLNYFKSSLAFPNKDLNKVSADICGTCFYVPKKIVKEQLKKFGFFLNPLFFAYAEDLELSIRLKRLNKKVVLYKETTVYHKGSLTAKRGSFYQLFWGFRNLIYIIILHWPVKLVLKNIFLIILGQFYILLLSFKKLYFLLYPKIIWHILKNISLLLFLRKKYDQECFNIFDF